MILIIAIATTLAVGAGLRVLLGTGIFDDFSDGEYIGHKRITLVEFAIGAALCAVVVVPATVVIGNKLALSNNLTYHEYWNGYETAAVRQDIECRRDGACQATYRCDPYTVHHPATYDSKGRETSPAYDTTEYHSCPEATVEWDFTVKTTLGDYHVERTFEDNPTPYRDSHGATSLRHGAPPLWLAVQQRLSKHDPGPVTKRMDYDNYILAAQSSILHKASSDIDRFKTILPAPSKGIRDLYQADKAYLVGDTHQDQQAWSDAVMRFDAAFGSDLQGDFHLVIAALGADVADQYTQALNAYWTGPAFGRDALSKNALVVVLGTDGTRVTWARAFTGMPRGNEQLLGDLQRELKGKPLTPALLGSPFGVVDGNAKYAGVVHGHGTIEDVVWGPDKFARVRMHTGYSYLSSEIQPTTAQNWLIFGVAVLLSLIIWIAMIVIGSNQEEQT